ncbi:hypothetical protein [Streptomyces sp. GbtcB6]|nr:hypothetical protein [Streptomyces sp. GbtcB6]
MRDTRREQAVQTRSWAALSLTTRRSFECFKIEMRCPPKSFSTMA